jgi:Zn-dependent protease with chaperone function
MNFFEQQDRAHRTSKQLIILLCLAVMSLIAITTLLVAAIFATSNNPPHTHFWPQLRAALSWQLVASISLGVLVVIAAGSFYKLIQLSGGGRAVAEALDAQLLNPLNATADERKVLNVVEEMAIASGIAVPPVYILEDDAINAFAAGYSPRDAIIGVTRGCIQRLKRDELQGVIAHEFSHIFHGDMRLNMRLVALLNGILLLGLIGEFLLRSGSYRSSNSRNKSQGGLVLLGIGLLVIGYAGTFFGKLIKAAVGRQREFLADASAVQYTRNPDGIGSALKKLGGYAAGSQLHLPNAGEFSHMFFGEALMPSFFARAMATHPSLEERIKRIDPHWDGHYPKVSEEPINEYDAPDKNIYIKEGRLSDHEGSLAYSEFAPPTTPVAFALAVENSLGTIGQPSEAHLAYARHTINTIPVSALTAAHNPWDAQGLMLGLFVAKNKDLADYQWKSLQDLFTHAQIESLQRQAQTIVDLGEELRLPLIEVALPALKNLSPEQYRQFKNALAAFIRADNKVTITEWSIFQIIIHNLETKSVTGHKYNIEQQRDNICLVLSAVANVGTNSVDHAKTAFAAACQLLDFNDATLMLPDHYGLEDLQSALKAMARIKPLQKPKLLKAVSLCVLADQYVSVVEAELFRAIADALDCPVPPMINANSPT